MDEPTTTNARNPDATDQMGRDHIGRLLLRFSVPSIVGMLVNALYNIVDRVFIGYGVGPFGIAGVTISFPLMLIMAAFSILVGVGANTLFSIRMGEGRKEEAEQILGNAFVLLFVVPLMVSLITLTFLDDLLQLIGASEALLPYARTYARIILCGAALGTTSHGLSHFIRSDGHPRISMIAMLIGAITNTILDAIFILGFRWGMAGAAWATVIAQGLSFTWCFTYFLSPRANTRLARKHMRLDVKRLVLPMLGLGFTPFAMNLGHSLLNAILNRSLDKYGGENAVAAMGILSAFMSLIFMPTFGITQGVQPLVGYNYGARNYRRVRQFFWTAVGAATVVMLCGWTASQLFPRQILRLFVPAGSELIPLGMRAFRIFTLAFPIVGFQIMGSNLFQAIGKPVKAGFMALTRQIILLIPFLLIFPKFWGLDGIFMAGPASDAFSFCLAWILISQEMRTLRRQEAAEQSVR